MLGRRTIFAFAAALPLVFSTTSSGVAQDLTKLTLALPSPGGLGYFGLYNAMGEGYFEAEGLEITPQSVNGSSQVIQALLSGQAELGHPGPGPVLNAVENGADIVYIYNYFARSQFNLVVPESSSYEAPSDLKGKIIGVGTADGAEVAFVRSILDDAGMTEGDDYTFLTVGEGGMAVAGFMQGSIDAYASDTAGVATLQLRGVPLRILTPTKFQSYFGNGYAVTTGFYEDNKDVLTRFGRALVKGMKFGMDPANRQATLENAKLGNPQQLEDMEFADALLDVYFRLTSPLDPEKGFGYQAPEAWQQWHDTLVAAGDLDAPLENLEAAYSNELIEAWNAD
ncbi:ABC transporter substrate-binding protein [Acuticoccus sediminis]|uniref:ABC transporter substrate-binding protein n=1 Tax=Acuticoccus sediminis TaxID=2184697 RepID=A0A8B2NR16_9HYPH|nr:ABC transporter substrate-binding protein [Acuticoccus sediminis]RAH97439.1 ABC transporter substrate-binding protein [Acuticoccus sediminis]